MPDFNRVCELLLTLADAAEQDSKAANTNNPHLVSFAKGARDLAKRYASVELTIPIEKLENAIPEQQAKTQDVAQATPKISPSAERIKQESDHQKMMAELRKAREEAETGVVKSVAVEVSPAPTAEEQQAEAAGQPEETTEQPQIERKQEEPPAAPNNLLAGKIFEALNDNGSLNREQLDEIMTKNKITASVAMDCCKILGLPIPEKPTKNQCIQLIWDNLNLIKPQPPKIETEATEPQAQTNDTEANV